MPLLPVFILADRTSPSLRGSGLKYDYIIRHFGRYVSLPLYEGVD